ncbi:putative rhoptry kinase family protein ROP34 [Besnoitia besnoiti]|uniref:non-specific serine/threonine protein kinase n=1 Tax=Besnoitia besnoiti TaxID=94643 RepID=A0A2A9M902_BESBE|nr:putative rhoptry kinase family protein ROP34 [Besnoitia besnoiti]PFH32376.1 putative rhoptry kinase family protein ROP34 [Besnoitia besnoiti]
MAPVPGAFLSPTGGLRRGLPLSHFCTHLPRTRFSRALLGCLLVSLYVVGSQPCYPLFSEAAREQAGAPQDSDGDSAAVGSEVQRVAEGYSGHADGRLPQGVSPGLLRRRLKSLVPGFLMRRRIYKALPQIDESQFPEFQEVSSALGTSFLDDARSEVHFFPKPSKSVLNLLSVLQDDVPYGIAIKAIPFGLLDFYLPIMESYIHRMVADEVKFPVFLPLLGVFRSARRRTVYLVFPLYRPLPGMLEIHAKNVNFVLLLAELAVDIRELHERNLTHRDIKEDNFLVDPYGHVVVADLATVEVTDELAYALGTEGYMPPETQAAFVTRSTLMPVRYGEKTDIYSLGKTFVEIASMLDEAGVAIPNKDRFEKLVARMTATSPADRPNIREVMDDSFFEDIDFQQVRERTGRGPFRKLVGADKLREWQRRKREAAAEKAKAENDMN